MKKFLIVVAMVVVLALVLVRNPYLDRVNPLIKASVSYAEVPTGTQQYEDVKVYSEKGKRMSYLLDFNGYDASKKFVKIAHKGKYVKKIEYLSLPITKK